MEVLNPLASLAREQINQFIDIDLEPEVDLEFKIYEWRYSTGSPYPENTHLWVEANQERRNNIEGFLNEGWQLDNQIVCPPFVVLIFSREKEEVKE